MTTTAPPPVQTTPPPATPPKRPRRWRRWLIAIGVTVVLVAGGGAIAGAVLLNSVQLGDPLPLPSTTTIYYADGSTVLAELGGNRRYELTFDGIDPAVRDVAVAAGDPDFWSDTAGPITRAVMRTDYDLRGDGFNVKVRLYALARKAEGAWGKEEVLRRYLNDVPFGRQTLGIEAAARAYFGKTAAADAPQDQRLTTAQAIYLLTLVDEPYPADPAAAAQRSQARWADIRAELAAEGKAPGEDAYPTPLPAPTELDAGVTGPTGLVVPQVLAELTGAQNSPLHGLSWEAIRDGGYTITTTIDSRAQAQLEAAIDETVPTSLLYGQPATLQAAGVLVEPGTGRVLAYYGGHEGTGVDAAGVYRNESGGWAGYGAHPVGNSFAPQVLAAALGAGMSIQSRWLWAPHPQAGVDRANPVLNTGTCSTSPGCTLREVTENGLQVPLYDITSLLGGALVLKTAAGNGYRVVIDGAGKQYDLAPETAEPVALALQWQVGLGEFRATVVDQAAAMAAFAGGGVGQPAHFVQTVSRGGDVIYGETLPAAGAAPVLNAQQLADLDFVLSQRSGYADLALQTGTWAGAAAGPVDAWSLGYTSALAGAIWVGNKTDQQVLRDKNGAQIYGSGLPTTALRQVLNGAQASLGLTPTPFPPPAYTGNLTPPGSISG